MAKESTDHSTVLNLRLNVAFIERLEALVGWYAKSAPSGVATKSDVARAALEHGLAVMEQQRDTEQ